MKKRLLWIVLCAFLISVAGTHTTRAFNLSGCEEKMFTVTAYYSPESGQVFYYKSNFQAEVVLNGEWHIGASGKKVFNGMLAWPSSYPFGSVIYFPWLGIGEIADRGGAIVLSWERGQNYDRIDIRMWKGEEWLIRALTFGKKNMTGYFCDDAIIKTSPKDSLLRNNVPVLKYFFDVAVRIQQLEEWRNDIRTRTLQKYLVKLWYLNKKHRNGIYEKYTKKALCAYQVHKKIISARSPDCGKFGKMTRYTMKLDIQNKGFLPDNLYEAGKFGAIIELAKYYNGKPSNSVESGVQNTEKNVWTINSELWTKKSSQSKIFLFYRAYTKWQQSSEIKILQNFLQTQWLYSGAIDGVYSKVTMNAIYEFQKKYSLISDTDPSILRGFLGPKTRAKINELRQKN